MNLFVFLSAVNGFLFVALGAFGAHGLKGRIEPDLMAVWETAAHYQGVHALALLGVGVLALHWPENSLLGWAGWLFLFGIVVFSGSLYLLAATGARWLGAVTPLGGTAFLVAWVLLAFAAWRANAL